MGEKEDGSDSIAIQVADENVRLCLTMFQFGWVADLAYNDDISELFANRYRLLSRSRASCFLLYTHLDRQNSRRLIRIN